MSVRRRLLSFPLLVVGWATALAATPFTLPAATLVGLVRRRRFVALRMWVFVLVYTSLEVAGLVLAAGIGASTPRRSPRWRERHYALQRWWAGTLFDVARRLLRLDLQVVGEEALEPGPILLLLRHASLADALLPAALVSRHHGLRLRYVLKKELLLDPCLDLVGNRLPNHFLDRAHPTDDDARGIAALAQDLGPDDGVVIYPEGTRFTPAKRARILSKLAEEGSPYLPRARALEHTLPPRVGGVAMLLDAAPHVDVVFCAHAGLEGFATFTDLLSGEVVGRTLRVVFWRVRHADIPKTREERLGWLYDQWARVDTTVRAALDGNG